MNALILTLSAHLCITIAYLRLAFSHLEQALSVCARVHLQGALTACPWWWNDTEDSVVCIQFT